MFSRKCGKAIAAGQGARGVRRSWKGQIVRGLLIQVDGSGFTLRVRGSYGSFFPRGVLMWCWTAPPGGGMRNGTFRAPGQHQAPVTTTCPGLGSKRSL